MVTVTTLKRFRDLKAHVTRMPGDSFQASEERAAQIAESLPGYIAYEAQPQHEDELSELKVAELKALCKERGITIPKNATKATLVGLLEA